MTILSWPDNNIVNYYNSLTMAKLSLSESKSDISTIEIRNILTIDLVQRSYNSDI